MVAFLDKFELVSCRFNVFLLLLSKVASLLWGRYYRQTWHLCWFFQTKITFTEKYVHGMLITYRKRCFCWFLSYIAKCIQALTYQTNRSWTSGWIINWSKLVTISLVSTTALSLRLHVVYGAQRVHISLNRLLQILILIYIMPYLLDVMTQVLWSIYWVELSWRI